MPRLENGTGTYPARAENFVAHFPQPRDYAVTPAGIQRNVTLAAVLEPLVAHHGKTTRAADWHPKQRFAFFLTAGVNIGESFRELGERLVRVKTETPGLQPPLYDLALQAQIESKRQRDGGRINEGIIAMLVPVVASQVLYLDEPPDPTNIDKVFANVETVMKNTSEDDAKALLEMARIAWTMSGFEFSQPHIPASNVYEYYQIRQSRADKPWFEPFLNNFSTAQKIVKEVLATQERRDNDCGFQDIFSDVCARIQTQLPDSYNPGQLADDTALALYILLSHFPDAEIVF